MNPVYPTNPIEWREWILTKLGLSFEDANDLLDSRAFPYDELVRIWEREFISDAGYSSNFIPALIRNKIGFVRWVYRGGNEPVWTGTDVDEQR